MRGVADGSGRSGRSDGKRRSAAVLGLLTLVLPLLWLLAGCADSGGGLRDEGPGRTVRPGEDTASPDRPAPVGREEAVELLRQDPSVSKEVRSSLTRCAGEWPVDVSSGDLTGGSANDLVINVITCADAIGIGTYVYRLADGAYENVYASQTPPVYGEIDARRLVVTRQLYDEDDPVAVPSGEDVITYAWAGSRFLERDRTHNDYSKTVGGDGGNQDAGD